MGFAMSASRLSPSLTAGGLRRGVRKTPVTAFRFVANSVAVYSTERILARPPSTKRRLRGASQMPTQCDLVSALPGVEVALRYIRRVDYSACHQWYSLTQRTR